MLPSRNSLEWLPQSEEAIMDQFPSPPASGPARVVWFIGLLVTVAGGALFVIGVVSFMADIARALAAEQPTAPDMGPFIRAVTVGFPPSLRRLSRRLVGVGDRSLSA